MVFDDISIESLPDDPREAIISVCTEYWTHMRDYPHSSDEEYQFALQGYAFLDVLLEAKGLKAEKLAITGDKEKDVQTIRNFVNKLRNDMHIKIRRSSFNDYRSAYTMKLDTVFHYEFSDGDLTRIQTLVNELRDLISATEELEQKHKQRVLRKLEKLQSELHKRVSDLDRFWGFFIDASIVVGLMGENAKPMVDVIQKIVRIIWPTQTRAYELPSDFPFKLLGQAEDDKSEDGEL